MSETYREQFPLLYDDLSDEEHYSPQFHRQYRQMTYRGRARSNVKGAVAIIKRWPDHWSSFLTYWWMCVVMIGLMTFIIYNSLFALSVLPTAHFKPVKSKVPSFSSARHKSQEITPFSNVYVHVFTENKKYNDLNKHLKRLEVMANKHPTFNYHLIVVLNDTITDYKHEAEENNVNALNSLWTTDITKSVKATAYNIKIQRLSLTEYLDNSPISKYWRMLPNQLIEFFVRAVSIWDKGGITFNPTILTPSSSNSAYIKEIEKTFKLFEYSEPEKHSHKTTEKPLHVNNRKFKQKVNNIRDIINILEHDNSISIGHDEVLTEAESKNIGIAAVNTDRRIKIENSHTTRSINKRDTRIKSVSNNDNDQENAQTVQTILNSKNSSSRTVLPAFLEYLFHHNTINYDNEDSNIKNTEILTKYGSNKTVLSTDSVLESENITNLFAKDISKVDQSSYRPMIVPAKELNIAINETTPDVLQQYRNENTEQHLIMDLKGNLLATKTACHAFLGTIFTDAVHSGPEETLSDFLIKELSMFCKGVLSSCSGINLILL